MTVSNKCMHMSAHVYECGHNNYINKQIYIYIYILYQYNSFFS